ncbi:MAG: glycosyltransferase [Nanoarchaeota archaeon]
MKRLNQYEPIVGKRAIETLQEDADPLRHKHILHINSTFTGGGVSEILRGITPLMNDLGMRAGWRVIKGNPDFYSITKSFHNAIQGDKINLTVLKKKNFEDVNRDNAYITHIEDHDCMIVHDPQPLPLINYYKKRQPWIWRCHIDASQPYNPIWKYLSGFINKYDRAIVSKKEYAGKLKLPYDVVHPAIDPLGLKNIPIKDFRIRKMLRKFSIDQDKPIICQVSRFDKWKDPLGVIQSFRKIRKEVNCRLVLLGSFATDDPDGQAMYNQLFKEANGDPDIQLINFENDILVNALQRSSQVVMQKSIKEGFGLTVSEALYKKVPVVAGNAGGIPLQVRHGKSGYLVNSIDSCAQATVKLLKNRRLRQQMGSYGHNHVKEHFLITRQLQDYVKFLKRELLQTKPI